MMTIQKAFDNFMASDFEATVDSSTKASWGGGAYAVELFEDGYRIMDKNSIGNLYDSPGLILIVPHLNDEEWDEDYNTRFYGNAEDKIREWFADAMSKQMQLA